MKILIASIVSVFIIQLAAAQGYRVNTTYLNIEGVRAQKMFEAANQVNVLNLSEAWEYIEEDRYISSYFIGDIRCESNLNNFECSVNDKVLNNANSKIIFTATSNLTERFDDEAGSSTYATDLRCIVETHKKSKLVEYRCHHAVN